MLFDFHLPPRSSMRFVLLVACLSVTAASIVAIPPAHAAKSLRDVWTTIVRVLAPWPPQRKNAGGKGPESILSPGVWRDAKASQKVIQEVWHNQPVILYQSPWNQNDAPDRIQLVDRATKQPVQTFQVNDQIYAKLTPARVLQAGNTYQIHQLQDGTAQPIDASVEFVVMPDGPRRKAITAKLTKLDCQLSDDPDQRSEERIKVFVAEGLWSDVLQELSEFVKTDADWQSFKTETIDQWSSGK
jgi:hypothetical protein